MPRFTPAGGRTGLHRRGRPGRGLPSESTVHSSCHLGWTCITISAKPRMQQLRPADAGSARQPVVIWRLGAGCQSVRTSRRLRCPSAGQSVIADLAQRLVESRIPSDPAHCTPGTTRSYGPSPGLTRGLPCWFAMRGSHGVLRRARSGRIPVGLQNVLRGRFAG